MTNKKKGRPNEGSPKDFSDRDHRPPAVTEAAARVHDLRTMGYNIITTILPEVEFRGAFAAASRCTRWACRRGLLRAGLEVAA